MWFSKTHCVAGNSEGFHAGSRHGGVLGLSVQMLEPVLQILLVIADHLKLLKHASYWMDTHTSTVNEWLRLIKTLYCVLNSKKCESVCPYPKAQKHFYDFHSLLMGSPSSHSKVACPKRNKGDVFSLCLSS